MGDVEIRRIEAKAKDDVAADEQENLVEHIIAKPNEEAVDEVLADDNGKQEEVGQDINREVNDATSGGDGGFSIDGFRKFWRCRKADSKDRDT